MLTGIVLGPWRVAPDWDAEGSEDAPPIEDNTCVVLLEEHDGRHVAASLPIVGTYNTYGGIDGLRVDEHHEHVTRRFEALREAERLDLDEEEVEHARSRALRGFGSELEFYLAPIERTATHTWIMPDRPPVYARFDGEPIWHCLFDRPVFDAICAGETSDIDVDHVLPGALGRALYDETARGMFRQEILDLAKLERWMQAQRVTWGPPTSEMCHQYSRKEQLAHLQAARRRFRDQPRVCAVLGDAPIEDVLQDVGNVLRSTRKMGDPEVGAIHVALRDGATRVVPLPGEPRPISAALDKLVREAVEKLGSHAHAAVLERVLAALAREPERYDVSGILRLEAQASSDTARVHHKKFGPGVILRRVEGGKVVVQFDSGDERTLLERFVTPPEDS